MVKNFPIEFNRSKQLDKGYLIVKKAVGNINYHYHDFYELEFVVSGSATVIVNGNEMTLTRGGAYLLRPTDIHEFSANTKTEIYSVHFLPHFIDEKHGEYLVFLNSEDIKKQVDADSKYLMHVIETVRRGKGCNEDIQSALMKLQHSSARYSQSLYKNLEVL